MGPSIFYGHNKQQSRKMCFCFPPVPGEKKGCCPEHQHQEEVGSCRAGTALPPARSQGGGLVLHLPEQRSWKCLPPLTQARPVPAPVPNISHGAATRGCSMQHLLYRIRLVQNGKNGLGQEAQSTAQPPAALRKRNPSFLLQKLFASVLLPFLY